MFFKNDEYSFNNKERNQNILAALGTIAAFAMIGVILAWRG
jgi:putative flippase GtrA